MNNAKKQRKTAEWERLEISSRKPVIPRGTFHAKMGRVKDRNGMELIEEGIKRDSKNTQRNYTKNFFMTQITMML